MFSEMRALRDERAIAYAGGGVEDDDGQMLRKPSCAAVNWES
jgi:hypothetical protein